MHLDLFRRIVQRRSVSTTRPRHLDEISGPCAQPAVGVAKGHLVQDTLCCVGQGSGVAQERSEGVEAVG
jgi:hypothetical protein